MVSPLRRAERPAPRARMALAKLAMALSVLLSILTAASAREVETIRLDVSRGETVYLDGEASSVFVADPEIADVQTPSRDTIFVFGKRPGTTTLFALDPSGNQLLSARVSVSRSGAPIEGLLREELGGMGVTARPTSTGILLTGTVADARTAQKAVDIAETFLGDGGSVTNRLTVRGGLQVKLRVRVAEVSRRLSKELGFNWDAVGAGGNFAVGLATGRPALDAAGGLVRSATGAGSLFGAFNDGTTDISAVIDALAEDGLVSILAEPSLTAMSGEAASFLAGGEFPIPVVGQGDAVTVQYRTFGVQLEFVPTVLSNEQISMRVAPEVSELSDIGAVRVRGFQIPAIRTRRADTTVELASGQSFAIGGLIQNNFSTSIRRFPGLGDLPILGALFRSSSFQREETELIIIVTPYIVKPVAQDLVAPTDLVSPPTDIERILFGQLTGASTPRWIGPAGFIAE